MLEDAFEERRAEENFVRKLRGYVVDDLETNGVQTVKDKSTTLVDKLKKR